MKTTTAATKATWASGDFVGEERRPTARVTIQKMVIPHIQYRLDDSRSKQWAHSGGWLSMMFGQEAHRPRELHNVRSVKWSRGVDTDVGSCTIVLGNVRPRSDSDEPSDEEMDFPGYYTPNRGSEDYFDRWGYLKNEWANWLAPDRLIRTWEGYGVDRTVAAELDPHLYPSGVWLIDDVTLDTSGLITLECRDVGRALLDQVVWPPAVPWEVYPLWWSPFEDRGKAQEVVATGTGWINPIYQKDSNLPYRHSGLTDNGRPLVNADGTVYGHHGRDAFDASTFTAWLSSGKRTKHEADAYEFIQGRLATPGEVSGVKVNAEHGPYRMYVSLQKADGTWLGRKHIPYKAGNVDVNANIPYVAVYSVQKGEIISFELPKTYTDIKAIRYTFGDLPWVGIGDKMVYRAYINSVYYCERTELDTVAGTWKFGNYSDYTNIVKWFLAWAGWFWPSAESGLDVITYSDGSTETVAPASNDPAMVDGRVWGDFEMSGTTSLAKLDVDQWDKKPFMDCIGNIREILGYDFWIDETGGAMWRLPNIFSKGCYVMPTRGGPRASRTTALVEIDDDKHLLDLSSKLSSRSIRERVYVGNSAGHHGAIVRGYRPNRTGLARYGGWTDQHFKSNDECERMADLIALKQMFLYRQNTFTITANPALQPDDQVIIYERMTGEGYIHRILNIASDFDEDTGKWSYALTTNWLGNAAFTKLAWKPEELTNPTKVYLHNIGHI